MTKYYYLVASFPVISLDRFNKNLDFESIFELIVRNLTPEDLRYFQFVLYPSDIKNLINSIAERRNLPPLYPMQSGIGTMALQSMKNINVLIEHLPAFLAAEFEGKRELLDDMELEQLENQMLQSFYKAVSMLSDSFLKDYFRFDCDLRNILTACNARKFGFDPKPFLIGDNPIKNNLTRSHAVDFGIGDDYPYIDNIQQLLEEGNPIALEHYIDKLRWNYIDELTSFSFFDRHVVFGYFIKLMMVKRWVDLEAAEDGARRLDKLVTDIMEDFAFPEIFR
jgi:hypothetical protein